jgi:2-C-methyl-D-erythritol 4-phosphate cytidylyltransferase
VRVAAVVVAAGSSRRFGQDKLWLPLAGRPVVEHSLAVLASAPSVVERVLVVRAGEEAHFAELAERHGARVVPGGAERQDSVAAGLAAVTGDPELVAIQDAARPLLTVRLLDAVCEAAREHGAAVCGHPVSDTLKEVDAAQLVRRTPPRQQLMAVQTPQVFHTALIRQAYAALRAAGIQVTDDTAAVERLGHAVKVVTWIEPNPKITWPDDVRWVEHLLERGG